MSKNFFHFWKTKKAFHFFLQKKKEFHEELFKIFIYYIFKKRQNQLFSSFFFCTFFPQEKIWTTQFFSTEKSTRNKKGVCFFISNKVMWMHPYFFISKLFVQNTKEFNFWKRLKQNQPFSKILSWFIWCSFYI